MLIMGRPSRKMHSQWSSMASLSASSERRALKSNTRTRSSMKLRSNYKIIHEAAIKRLVGGSPLR